MPSCWKKPSTNSAMNSTTAQSGYASRYGGWSNFWKPQRRTTMARGTNKTKTTRPPREQTTERKERVRSGKTAARPDQVPADHILLGAQDLHFFNEGTHARLYEKLGAHPLVMDGVAGTAFAVWAPDAEQVSVIGEFNDWNTTSHPLFPKGQSGIWERFFPGIEKGTTY